MNRLIFLILIFALLLSCSGTVNESQQAVLVSKPGQYQGYSKPVFDSWIRTSQYLHVRDGTKIAIDIFRPVTKGKVHTAPLPVIWEHCRYQRASIDQNGNIRSQLDRDNHPMREVVLHGYIFAVAAVRGSGASFGTRTDPIPPIESLDAYDITEWLAAQPWCDGQVGMYGISYSGMTQFMAASTSPPHLKAIFPEMAMFDLYELCYPGGIFRHAMMIDWAQQIQGVDRHITRKAAPVDGDEEHILLKQALEQHKNNVNMSVLADAPYRDTALIPVGLLYKDNSSSTYIEDIRKSRIAVYLRTGWYDIFPRDMLLWFNNLDMPKKIIIGPWNHYQSYGLDRAVEILRWYDYWLKGINNGIMDEPPIHYIMMGAPDEDKFRKVYQWPLPQTKTVKYYFHKSPSGSVKSVNDGLLNPIAPNEGFDSYITDYTTTTGRATRWYGQAVPAYPDMTTNDQKALTYTTEPLTIDIEILGHPVVHIWLQCSANDVDVFAYLEEVDTEGRSHYITEGCLRASHRTLSKAPYNCMGLPYHRSFKQDMKSLSEKPVELVFDLLPTARHFRKNHRIRLTITCSDKDNARTPILSPPPRIKVFHNESYASFISLPVM